MRVSLGCHVLGAANPVPDISDTQSLLHGVIKRVASKTPDVVLERFEQLMRFAKYFNKTFLKTCILEPNVDLTVEGWLKEANYPLYRKQELLAIYQGTFFSDKVKHRYLKSFGKDESHPEYKYPRGIYARSDLMKTKFGPFFHRINQVFFQICWTIKKCACTDRPTVLLKHLNNYTSSTHGTDFSSFEAMFVKLIFELEFQFYEFCYQNSLEGIALLPEIKNIITGTNVCYFSGFKFEVECKRMSGEMNTSIGNTYFNMIVSFFLMYSKNLEPHLLLLEPQLYVDLDNGDIHNDLTETGNKIFNGEFEGDDGVLKTSKCPPSIEDYTSLGANIKIVEYQQLSEASFCGMIFDEVDQTNVTNPIFALLDFGYTTSPYLKSNTDTKMQLLRSKSLSLAYQYPACPILTALARYGLRMTVGVKIKQSIIDTTNEWRRNLLQSAVEEDSYDPNLRCRIKSPRIGTRLLVAKLYNISCEVQCIFEHYLDSLKSIQPLNIEILNNYIHQDCFTYYQNYSKLVNTNDTYMAISEFQCFVDYQQNPNYKI
jgi:hypothetical protein